MNGLLHNWFRSNNQDGFILPLTMIVTFLLFAFLLYQIKMYETEKQFLQGREEMLVTTDLLQMASVDIERQFKKSPTDQHNGTFDYTNGKVTYMISSPPKDAEFTDSKREDVIYITLKASTDNAGVHVSYAYYDRSKQKIIRWVEPV